MTGLERFSASARWHEISAVTPCWEGGDSIKNSADARRRRLLLPSRYQQSRFHCRVFQCHLFSCAVLRSYLSFCLPPLIKIKEALEGKFKHSFKNKDISSSLSIIRFPFHALLYDWHCLRALPRLFPLFSPPLLRMSKFSDFALCPQCTAWHWVDKGHQLPSITLTTMFRQQLYQFIINDRGVTQFLQQVSDASTFFWTLCAQWNSDSHQDGRQNCL